MAVISSHHSPYRNHLKPQQHLQLCSKPPFLWNKKHVTQCFKSTLCIKYVDPITNDKYEIHFPPRIKVMNPFHTLTHTHTVRWNDDTALRDLSCVQRCFEDVLWVPSPSFPTTCWAFWASGSNQLSHTSSSLVQKAERNVTAETLFLQLHHCWWHNADACWGKKFAF